MTGRPDIELDRQRAQLTEAMSAVCEDRTCDGWRVGWDRTLHADITRARPTDRNP